MEIILLIVFVLYLLNKNKHDNRRDNRKSNQKPISYNTDQWTSEWKWNEDKQIWEHPNSAKDEPTQTDATSNDVSGYQAKYLLSKNEWYEHKKLREYAAQKGLVVCPKVRLLDIVEPIKGQGYMTRFHKIQAKHVDFVITDQQMHIKAILELDDNSHNTPDRKERDKFVDGVLTNVGYKVIRTRSITEDTLANL